MLLSRAQKTFRTFVLPNVFKAFDQLQCKSDVSEITAWFLTNHSLNIDPVKPYLFEMDSLLSWLELEEEKPRIKSCTKKGSCIIYLYFATCKKWCT